MGFSVVAFAIIFACSHHYVDGCDEDAKCWSFTNMLACHERYFGDIHTPEYLEAIRSGHNINRRTPYAAARATRHR